MTTDTFDGVSVRTQANVYFDGKCVSHSITLPNGVRKSLGVVMSGTFTFQTDAPEIMECVAGSCEYQLAGTNDWVRCAPGEQFAIAGQSQFRVQVEQLFHYICHYG